MSTPDRHPVDLFRSYINLHSSGAAETMKMSRGAPPDVDGFLVGAFQLTRNPPHGGEMHPDGDELLFVTDGQIDVALDGDTAEIVSLQAGDAFLVPQGVWHRLVVRSPTKLLHVTPGRSEHKPRRTKRT